MEKSIKMLLSVALPAFVVMGAFSALINGSLVDGLLTFGIGMSISMLIVAVFSQSGKVRLSPQREVAIATGHTDRKTVFERPLLRQFMLVILSLVHSVSMPRLKDWIRRKLVAEGNENHYTPEEYLAVSVGAGVALAAFLTFVYWAAYEVFSFAMIVIGLVFGTLASIYLLYNQAGKRLRQITRRVPYALDLVSLAMGAGATFTEAVKTVVHEDPEDPFNVELKTVLAEIELGETRRRALENLADRAPLDSLRSIVASVIQAEELGTPLQEVLHAQATLMRLHRSARAENAAAVASVRILVPSLLILMAVVLTVFGPAILRGIRGGLF
ncbi:MAG: type II secretion system F family protein [Planctomycetota bacterium]|jgi:tight adherence protein C